MTETAKLSAKEVERHTAWRRSLDDLLTAFITSNPDRTKPAVHMTYMELMEWSHKLTQEFTEND